MQSKLLLNHINLSEWKFTGQTLLEMRNSKQTLSKSWKGIIVKTTMNNLIFLQHVQRRSCQESCKKLVFYILCKMKKFSCFFIVITEKKCMECPGCKTVNDCGTCKYCKDKRKFGGPGIKKKACEKKKCTSVKVRFCIMQS